MKLIDAPSKLVIPFANSGSKNTIPTASQIAITPGAASLTDGFPPLTRTPIASGGIPPSGLDMNGILYEISKITRWDNAGTGYIYDSAFATDSNVQGYPKGSRVLRTDGAGYWLNLIDDNQNDPEGATPTDWVPDFTNGVTAVTMTNANVTLTPLQYGKPIIVISGALAADLNLVFPSIAGNWIVLNNTTGSYKITAKTAAGTGTVVVGAQAIFCDTVNIYAVSNGRTRLNANTTFYVSASGSDSTGTGASGAPWATLQKAYNILALNYDLNGYTVTISVADGTYTAGLSAFGQLVGQASAASLLIQGNTSTPANVIIGKASGNTFEANCGASFKIRGAKISNTGSASCLYASSGGVIQFDTCDFGASAGGVHLNSYSCGEIVATGNYTISGAASSHLNISSAGGRVSIGGVTVTLLGTPAITTFAAASYPGMIHAVGTSFSGSATGTRYNAQMNAVINTGGGGATFFPGNVGGSTTTGGQYV